MPRPTHRLDVLIVPAIDVPIERGELWLSSQVQRGRCLEDGQRGPEAEALVAGGFARLVLDRPGDVVLYANRTGGFQVRCPTTKEPVVKAFQGAIGAWRAGGPRQLSCPSCQEVHELDELDYRPRAAFGRWALIAIDAESASFRAAALEEAQVRLGPLRLVARRA